MGSTRAFGNDRKVYDPDHLLNTFKHNLKLPDDAALCHRLDMAPSVLQSIRSRTMPLGAWLLMRMSEVSELDVAQLRALMGDRRKRIRVAVPHGSVEHRLIRAAKRPGSENRRKSSAAL
jgi:hypothetical protein